MLDILDATNFKEKLSRALYSKSLFESKPLFVTTQSLITSGLGILELIFAPQAFRIIEWQVIKQPTSLIVRFFDGPKCLEAHR